MLLCRFVLQNIHSINLFRFKSLMALLEFINALVPPNSCHSASVRNVAPDLIIFLLIIISLLIINIFPLVYHLGLC